MSLSAEDLKGLTKINALFAQLESNADELGQTPDEYVVSFKKYNLGGVGNLEKDLPAVGIDRANIFAKSTTTVKKDEKVGK
ncbi:MAG: hypothetical protein M0D57_16075 [Sphingobacteriales bacterium JAD_PAG50586_3]|nr:MAG: hypothetical protein M0D57_16075 [Sphingobacteriales bacterium JAD_PAG50586_3]